MSAARREAARALRAKGIGYREIAVRLGCGASTAYRWCNSDAEERSRQTAREWKAEHPEHLREYYREYSQRVAGSCVECGGSMARSTDGVCLPCRSAIRLARCHQIEDMWLAGDKLVLIAAAVGWSTSQLGVEMHRMRAEGWNLPLRAQFTGAWLDEVAA